MFMYVNSVTNVSYELIIIWGVREARDVQFKCQVKLEAPIDVRWSLFPHHG